MDDYLVKSRDSRIGDMDDYVVQGCQVRRYVSLCSKFQEYKSKDIDDYVVKVRDTRVGIWTIM